MNRRRWTTTAHLAALAVLGVLLVAAAHHLDLARVAASLGQARMGWVVLALVCYVSILPLWAAQWVLLSSPATRPTYAAMLGIVSMTSSVLNTTPMLVGEAAAVVFLVRAGLQRAAALSVLAMDQLLVGIAKVFVLLLASSLLSLPAWAARGLVGLASAVVAALVVLLAISRHGAALRRGEARVVPARLARELEETMKALAPLRSPTLAGGALLLAFAKKAVEIVAIVCVQRAFGLHLPLASAVLVLAALNLSTLLPLVPGNVGVYEAAVVVAYSPFGVSSEQALALAVVQHACYFATLALPGYCWLVRSAPPSVEATS